MPSLTLITLKLTPNAVSSKFVYKALSIHRFKRTGVQDAKDFDRTSNHVTRQVVKVHPSCASWFSLDSRSPSLAATSTWLQGPSSVSNVASRTHRPQLGASMSRRLRELRSYLRGWMGTFGLANQLKLFTQLDGWIRRRIRMCYWKQWRRPRRRRQMLIRVGVPMRQAIRHARSRKSYWHMAKTIASGVGLTNAWLEERGLISIKTLWAKLAPLRRTASCGPAC